MAAVGAASVLISSGAAARGWHQFTTNAHVHPGVQRFADLGSGRYDFWRVAVNGFVAHPVGGLGQDNFAQAYVAARHTSEEPAWIHSLELRLLAHTGAVGFALFVAFVVCAIAAYRLRRQRRGDRGCGWRWPRRSSRSSSGWCTARSTGSGRSQR